MGVTGVVVWLAGRRGRPRIRGNQPAGRAETILLVGSEGGSTWGFAATLHAALTQAGQSVHAAPMSAFAPDRYASAPSGSSCWPRPMATALRLPRPRVFSTGWQQPTTHPTRPWLFSASATAAFRPIAPSPRPCRGCRRGEGLAELCRWTPSTASRRRTSPAGAAPSGKLLGIDLELSHQPVLPATETLTLVSRRDYGAEVQAPTAILRFALPKRRASGSGSDGAGFARFDAGDLIGILPEGIARAAPLLARLRAPRRVHRDRGEEAARRTVFRPTDRAGTRADASPHSCAAIPASNRAEAARR